jgi:hypothetical protein
MLGHGSKFGRKKEQAIVALLTHRNPARAIDIAPNTLLRWMKEPEFDAAYREDRRLAYGQSIARLQQAASAATCTLLKIMVDTGSPPSCRLMAANSVLSHAAKAIEIEDIDARVTELERSTELSNPDKKGSRDRFPRFA